MQVLLDAFAENYNSSVKGYTGIVVSFKLMFLGLFNILGIKKQLVSIAKNIVHKV